MFSFFELDNKLIVKIKKEIDINSPEVINKVKETLKDTGCYSAILSDHKGEKSRIIDNELSQEYTHLMNNILDSKPSKKSREMKREKFK
ncbi:hypothetical protein [Virgibacillus halodenitrificans]|uniref:Uncharacterized protein n=1 Tax=Virgibacillus halodenitrificans TaxID=1482 RepID=A0ABR7VV06_VIRHA|nr:hypothetical protein [Virgibacillus halodenitrificans]MBD1224793.1 hypothetical protein [Virgibacillus halodenitrificans]